LRAREFSAIVYFLKLPKLIDCVVKMNADWDEIKRLAADFQKAQLSSTLAR